MGAAANGAGLADDAYAAIGDAAPAFRVEIGPEELAAIAVENGFGEAELAAAPSTFSCIAAKRHDAVIETLPRLSRLPRKAPKTFDGFDFARIQGRDADAPRKLPSLSNLHAHGNLALIGPGGIGKAHLAQAYGRECCMQGYETYCLKASELRDKLARAADSENPSRAVSSLVKPSRLIVDEVGRCVFDKARTDLFFDVVDKRYEKDVPNTPVLTSNTPVNNWDEFFTGDDTLPCTLDRIFDKASVFVMRGPSLRGAGCDALSAEAVPSVAEARVQERVPTQIGQSHAGVSAILIWPGLAVCARLSGGYLCPALTKLFITMFIASLLSNLVIVFFRKDRG